MSGIHHYAGHEEGPHPAGPPLAEPAPVPDAPGERPGRRNRAGRWLDMVLSSLGQRQNPIVPQQTVVGRSLIVVTAIMSFLACLALGTAWGVHKAARNWTIDAAREVTVQIKPVEGVEFNAELNKALTIINATRGIVSARAYSNDDVKRILEPWLGQGIDIAELPVPKLIAITLDPVAPADLAALSTKLTSEVTGASVDDHRVWQAQVRAVARWIEFGAFVVLGLMLATTTAIMVFATRGAMSTNRDIVEVLHLVGARKNFIAGQFERHFLLLAAKGGLIGGACAAAVFLASRVFIARILATAPGSEGGKLIDAMSLGLAGYAAIAGIVAIVAVLAAITSRLTVYRYLKTMY